MLPTIPTLPRGFPARCASDWLSFDKQQRRGADLVLGDMPRVKVEHLEALIGAFEPADGREVVVPTFRGRQRQPGAVGSALFSGHARAVGNLALASCSPAMPKAICAVPMPDEGTTLDVDTPEALRLLTEQRGLK